MGYLFESVVDGVGQDFMSKSISFDGAGIFNNIFDEFFSNQSYSGSLSVGVDFLLVVSSGSDNHDEDSEDVTIRSFQVGININQSVSFFELFHYSFSVQFETIEVSSESFTVDVVDNQFNFLTNISLFSSDVSVANFSNSVLQKIR